MVVVVVRLCGCGCGEKLLDSSWRLITLARAIRAIGELTGCSSLPSSYSSTSNNNSSCCLQVISVVDSRGFFLVTHSQRRTLALWQQRRRPMTHTHKCLAGFMSVWQSDNLVLGESTQYAARPLSRLDSAPNLLEHHLSVKWEIWW